MELVDLVGVFAFALSGGLMGVRRHFDIVGIMVLAIVTALGGGMVRDMMLGINPPTGLSDVRLIGTAMLGGAATFWFSGTVGRARKLVLVADALGLGAFCVTAAHLTIAGGHPGIEAIAIGTITAVGGGVIRDVLSGTVPSIFTSEFYALPAMLGALAVDLLARVGRLDSASEWMVVGGVFCLRLLALKFHWTAPTPRRLERD